MLNATEITNELVDEQIAKANGGQLTIPAALATQNRTQTIHALKLLAWLIIDARPFSLSNSRRFREFMADFGYIPPSTRQLRRYTFLLVNGVNAMIRSKVKQLEFVSAAIDEWSSATLVPFLSICYQGFTNDMELLTFEDLVPFPAPHTAERYRMVIKQCIQDRAPSSNITLCALTSDGGRAGQNACQSIVGDGDALWCLAHLLQLIVNDVLKSSDNPYANDIRLVRTWVLEIRSHIITRQQLVTEEELAGVKEQQLILDVATRWNSVHNMITVFLKLWPAISKLSEKRKLNEYITPEDNITDEVIDRLRACSSVLQHFAMVTEMASAKSYPPIVFTFKWLTHLKLIININPTDSQLAADFKRLLLDSFTTRISPQLEKPSLLHIASVLDPLQHALPNQELANDVDKGIVKEILLLNPSRKLGTGETIPAASKAAAVQELAAYHAFVDANKEVINRNLTETPSWGPEAHQKLARWWATKSSLFPLLFRTARAILAISATSSNCERAFSAAGNQFAIKRRSMDPETLTALCLIQGNIGESSLDELIEAAISQAETQEEDEEEDEDQ